MVSITNRPFPIARGEDGKRVAKAFEAAKNPPAKGSMAHRLLRESCARRKRKNDGERVFGYAY